MPHRTIRRRIAIWGTAVLLLIAWYFASPPFVVLVARRHFPTALPSLRTIYAPSEYYATHESIPGSALYRSYLGESSRRINEALRKPIDPHAILLGPTIAEFSGTPLRDVSSYLSELHAVPLDLDPSVDGNVGVTVYSQRSLQQALEEMLKPHGLMAIADGERILISTPEAIDRKRAAEEAEKAAHTRIVQSVIIVLIVITVGAVWLLRRSARHLRDGRQVH